MANLGDLLVRVGANIEGFEKAMGTVSSRLNAIDREASRSFSGFDKLGTRLSSLGGSLTLGLTAPLTAIGGIATKVFGEFEGALNRVAALGGITGDALKRLEQQALDLGASTQFSATQAAEAMAEYAGAGFNAEQISAAMAGTLNLAAAGQMAVGESAKITSDILGQFGLAAGDAGRVADVLAAASSDAKASLGDMGMTLAYIGPQAKQLGMSLEDTTATIVALDQAGIRGEKAGTGLRGVLASIVAPSTDAAEAMATLGIKIDDGAGKMLPFSNIIEQFRTKLGGLGSDVEKQRLIFEIFGREAGNVASVLIDKGGPALDQFAAKIRAAEDPAKTMAERISQGLGGALEKMKGSVETAAIALGQVLAPYVIQFAGYIETAADKLADFIKWFQSLPGWVQSGALAFAALAAAIGPVTFGLGTLLGSVTDIAGGIKVLSSLLGMSGGVAGLLSAAAPLAIAFGAAIAAWAIYEAATEVSKLNDELDRLYEAQQRGVRATQQQAQEIQALESALKAHNATVGSQRVEVDSAGKTIDQYLAALREAVKGLDEYKGAALQANEATKDGKVNILAAVAAYIGIENSASKAKDAHSGAAGSANTSGKAHDALAEAVKKAEKAYTDAARAYLAGKASAEQLEAAQLRLRAAQDAADPTRVLERHARAWEETSQRVDRNIKDYIAACEKLNAMNRELEKSSTDLAIAFGKAHEAMREQSLKTVEITVPMTQRLPQAVQDAIKANEELEGSLKRVGGTTVAELDRAADQAEQDFERIKASGKAAPDAILKAELAYLKASIDARRAHGETITSEEQARLKQLEGMLGQHTDKQTKTWESWARQVSTIMSDLGKDIADAFLNIFRGNPENDRLKQEESDLQASLQTREQEWEQYKVDVAKKLEELRVKHAEELAQQEADLAAGLEEKRAEYEQYVADVTGRIEEIREKHAKELAEEVGDLQGKLAEKEQAYEEYRGEVLERIEEIRETHAEQMEEELEDLRENLRDRTEEYEDFVEDVQTKLGRLRIDTEDDIGDETRSTNRNIADKQKEFKREEEDTRAKITRLRAAGKKGYQYEIRDLEQALERKREDMQEYIRRENEDLQDFIEEKRRKQAQEEADLRESLARKTRDHQQYVEESKQKEDEIVKKHKEAVEKQTADLMAGLKTRGEELERFRVETAGKIEAVTRKHKEEEDKQVADLKKGLAEKTVEWERYKTEASKKLEDLREDAKIKLEADEAQLEQDLSDARTVWENYKNDVNAKLNEIRDKISGPVDSIKKAFADMFEAAGQAIVRFGTEYLTNKLFKWLKEDLGGILDGLLGKMKEIFGVGAPQIPGGSIPNPAGTPDWQGPLPGPPPSTPPTVPGGGGGVGSAVGGVAGAVNLVSGVISAAASVVTAIGTLRLEGTMNAVEHNTRYSMMYLGERGDGGILGVLFKISETLQWGTLVKVTEQIRDALLGWRSSVFGDKAEGGPDVRIRDNFGEMLAELRGGTFVRVLEQMRDMLAGTAPSVLSGVTPKQPAQLNLAATSDQVQPVTAEADAGVLERIASLTGDVLGTARDMKARMEQMLNPYISGMEATLRNFTALPWQPALEAQARKQPLYITFEVDGRAIAEATVEDITALQAYNLRVAGQLV